VSYCVTHINGFMANLFTVFTKLASQLSADKLADLAIIPVIFAFSTAVSYTSSKVVSRIFGLKKRESFFVTAMGVFGNSNSLPISLVVSLAKTLPGLHWDKIPGDNDEEVAARGILYLLIFQQLGQLVRWSWGYHVLLAPPEKFTVEEGGTANGHMEEGRYQDEASTTSESRGLLIDVHDEDEESISSSEDTADTYGGNTLEPPKWHRSSREDSNGPAFSSSSTTLDELHSHFPKHQKQVGTRTAPVDSDPFADQSSESSDTQKPPKTGLAAVGPWISEKLGQLQAGIAASSKSIFARLPRRMQLVLIKSGHMTARFMSGLWMFMNPPLWSMLIAIIVASIPRLQALFFTRGTFLNTSVTRAVEQSGGVAVPLILVVLGANLARNTIPKHQLTSDDPKLERKLLYASLISRMLLPTVIMAPILALVAKFVPVSIVDDPVFVVVCFLLTGAPSALQLAQICQLNNVYLGAMTNLLFQSYVIW
jgi:predicted permease